MRAPTALQVDMTTSSTVEEQIESLLRKHVAMSEKRNPFSGSTVGLEQEFFVFKKDGKALASLSDTQRLFHVLSQKTGWKAISQNYEPSSRILTRVSYEHAHTRYTALKYEFPPHLLELAFAYYDDLNALEKEIKERWNELTISAEECELTLVLTPFIPKPNLDLSELALIDSKLRDLSNTRRAFFLRRHERVDENVVDFPSFMAATQAQVKIPHAWCDPKFMHRIYALELVLMPILNETPATIAMRQLHYTKVFKGLKLLGVPELDSWTTNNWITALIDSPLSSNKEVEAKTLREVATSSGADIQVLLKQTRDLQIIRPKPTGTIEFRGDGAATTLGQMIRLASIRFAASIIAFDPTFKIEREHLSFPEIRAEWNARLNQKVWTDSQNQEAERLFHSLATTLKRRGRKEEVHLFL